MYICQLHRWSSNFDPCPVCVEKAKREVDEWIGVEERLPEVPPAYYDSSWGGDVTPMSINVIAFDGEDVFESTFFKDSGFGVDNVTHWQYFPNPPKQELTKQSA